MTASGFVAPSIARWETSPNNNPPWTIIGGSASSSITVNGVSASLYYRAVATTSLTPTNAALLNVSQPSAGVVSSNATVCKSLNSGTLTLAGTYTTVNYWEYSTNGGSTWANIPNNTNSQTYLNLATTTIYRANVTNGSCPAANATAATITVNPTSVGGSTTASVTTVCAGSNSGTITLSGNTGTIIWQNSTNGGITWGTLGSTANTLNFLNLIQTTSYRVIVTSGICSAAISSPVTITVSPVSVGGTTTGSTSVCTGANNGSVTLSGQIGSVLNWSSSINGGTTWTTIANTANVQNYTNLTTTTLYRATVQSGSCSSANSTSSTITVSPNTVAGSVSGAASVCAGSNGGTLTLSGYTGTILRWENSVNGGITWGNINNGGSATYNYSNIYQTTLYRAVVQNGTCAIKNSSSATVTVSPFSVGGTTAGSATVCMGVNSGSITLNGRTGNVLNWSYSVDGGITWIMIANTTTTQNYSNLTMTTLYRATVQSGSCASANSTSSVITVSPITVAGSVSGAAMVCAGSNSGTLTLSGYTGTILRWESSINGGVTWVNINNGGSTTYNYSNINQSTDYRAVVQSCTTNNSSSATITVSPISVGGTANSSATVCSGNNNGLLDLTGYVGSITSWEKSMDNGTTWTTIVNTTDTLSYSNLTLKTLYRANVLNGVCAIKKSTIATIKVNTPSVGGTVASSDIVCSGSNSGSLSLSGYAGSILYWQSSIDGGATWSSFSNTAAFFNYLNIVNTTSYRAVIQSGGCAAANSSDATINVYPISVGGSIAPAAFAACSGINNGTVILSGQSGNILRWESSIDGGATWTNIANTTTSQNFQNLTITTEYRAVMQNGQCSQAYSAVSTITVLLPTVGGNLSGSDTICGGSNSGSLTLSGYAGSIIYWECSTDGGVTWSMISNTTSVQNYTNLAITRMYRAVVQSGSCSTANSTNATIFVIPATIGGSVLSSRVICNAATSGILTLNGYTGNILRWEKSTDGGTVWATIANTTNTYSYSNITTATIYRADVQNGVCSSAISAPATISLAEPAHAAFTMTITNGAKVTFTNTSTSNSGTSHWNFGDGTNSTTINPSHTYSRDSSFTVTLTVTDSCGSDVAAQTVSITGVGINEIAYNNPDISVYPNPFSETAVLQFTNRKQITNYEFKMYSIYGKEVSVDIIRNTDRFVIHRGNLASGIYLYKLQTPDTIIAIGKIVIQ